MTDVLMPRLSDSMQEGTILTWLAADGDDIVEGQELVEVETDKATMTQLSEASGVLSIVVSRGDHDRGRRGDRAAGAGRRGRRGPARPARRRRPQPTRRRSPRQPPQTVPPSGGRRA